MLSFLKNLIFCFSFACSRWNNEKKEGDIAVIYSETKLYQWEFPRAAWLRCQNCSVWPASGNYLWGRWHTAATGPGKQAWQYSYHTSGFQCEAGSPVLVLQNPGDEWFWCFPSTHTSDKLRAHPRSRKDHVCGFCPAHPTFTGSNFEWRQPRTRNRNLWFYKSHLNESFSNINFQGFLCFPEKCSAMDYHQQIPKHYILDKNGLVTVLPLSWLFQ